VDRTGQLDIPHVMAGAPEVQAAVYVSIGGHISPHLPAFEPWCRVNGIDLVTDMSHAIGSSRDRRGALSYGLVSVASMFATKVVTAGEGAIVTSDDPAVLGLVRSMRDGGRREAGWTDSYEEIGLNARMSDLHASLANVHLASLPERIARRRVLALEYDRLLLGKVEVVPWTGGSLYKYLVLVHDRRSLLARLPDVRPAAGVWDLPVWLQPGYVGERASIGSAYPALAWARDHVALPMHENLTLDDVRLVAERVVEAVE
jgi:dTDP-4-amino-4,6-dideoxygalactose transaminase